MTDDLRENGDLDQRVRVLAQAYHEPPATPREAIWARIAARRAGVREDVAQQAEPGGEVRVLPIRRRMVGAIGWLTGIAAILTIGIGLGRLTRTGENVPAGFPVVADRDTAPPTMALQVATAQHLSRVEAFLTGFRSTGPDSLFAQQARDLLASTRLLLDTRVATDPRTLSLLQDLELILIQIVQLREAAGSDELELITDGLEQNQVLPRLRTEIPAGPSVAAGAS